ncbi:hypothetical protein BK742_21530 [Bacillus thuringiensis serovar pingluonsis]|uniref:Uncharacterized protein n=1 Tax=Bacillus thuringiensis serovar pingluonsis TaxID=180881 RepID=A0A243B532_BACTU|nr:hypothetical protein BK742_21530 [Bacillus thuringiensis serovar pingluonsis]
MNALLAWLVFCAGTKWLVFLYSISSYNLLYQVIKELHSASFLKACGYTKPQFISHIPWPTALHKFEKEEVF